MRYLRSLAALPILILCACTGENAASQKATESDAPAPVAIESEGSETIKLYAINCGKISLPDIGIFSANGEYNGRAHDMAVTCFLITHPKGALVWDAGLPDALNALPKGQMVRGVKLTVPVTMESQLASIGVPVGDVDYFAPSHTHFDHVGNVGLFLEAKMLIQASEHEFMEQEAPHNEFIDEQLANALLSMTTLKLEGEHDVFGDGSVTIIPTPGHTPGHSVLRVNLANYGPVLLTGDLYHLNESRTRRIYPAFNVNAEQTKLSMAAFEKMVEELSADVFIQHSEEDAARLPKLPDYLD